MNAAQLIEHLLEPCMFLHACHEMLVCAMEEGGGIADTLMGGLGGGGGGGVIWL